MKRITCLLLLGLIVGCNSATKKESESDSVSVSSTDLKKVQADKNSDSGDYSTLLNGYTCDMTVTEIAEVLQVNEADLKLSTNDDRSSCYVDINGFSTNPSRLYWRSIPGSKKSHKKMIAEKLEHKKNNISIVGMTIEESENGEFYVSHQPLAGRILLLNENYDMAFMLGYGTKITNAGRTKEQHEELKQKMTDLANYLLKKHRK